MDGEEANSKQGNTLEQKAKKEPIFFNSGLVYKPPPSLTNPKPERRIEEKSENYPTIMEHQNKHAVQEYEKKVHLFGHPHERPRSTNTEQKKEVAENIQNAYEKKPKSIFNEIDEKSSVKFESSTRKNDLKINNVNNDTKDSEVHHKEKEITQNKVSNNIHTSANVKVESLKERLNFINGQCYDIIYHLDIEQNK